VGDRVFPGQQFMKIVDTTKMEVDGVLNQTESGDLRIGQSALIKLDAFPELEFKGKVHSIGALANGGFRNSYYVRNVPVRVKIEGSDPKLIPDLSASATVTVEHAESGPLVPLSAVASEDGKRVAFVKAGEKFESREVQLGVSNGTHAAVRSGLQPGDQVRVN
jgi:multidrug efflux pump subunit AcrA (membrane-fusion protein)